jgi:hypothetical protein
MKYIVPVCKVLTLNTKKNLLEDIVLATSEGELPVEAQRSSLEFEDAVDDLFGGKVQY